MIENSLLGYGQTKNWNSFVLVVEQILNLSSFAGVILVFGQIVIVLVGMKIKSSMENIWKFRTSLIAKSKYLVQMPQVHSDRVQNKRKMTFFENKIQTFHSNLVQFCKQMSSQFRSLVQVSNVVGSRFSVTSCFFGALFFYLCARDLMVQSYYCSIVYFSYLNFFPWFSNIISKFPSSITFNQFFIIKKLKWFRSDI